MINKITFWVILSFLLSGFLYSGEIQKTDSSFISPDKDIVDSTLSGIPAGSIISKDSSIIYYKNNGFEPADTLQSVKDDPLPKWYDMITKVPGDWYYFTKDQFHSPNYPVYLLITGLTAGLIITDDYTWKQSDKFYNKNQINRNWSDIFTEIGDGRSQFGFAAAFAAYGFITDDHHALKTASQIVEAVLAAGSVVQLFKHITGRESPFVSTKTGGAWRFFPNQIQYHKHVPSYDAFPSGHIATSVAAFVVIAENYPQYKWIKPVSYGLTALIGIGMANKGIHWYSDYPLGIALGYAFGKMIAHPENFEYLKSDSKDKLKINLLPYIDAYSKGITLNLNF